MSAKALSFSSASATNGRAGGLRQFKQGSVEAIETAGRTGRTHVFDTGSAGASVPLVKPGELVATSADVPCGTGIDTVDR